jgi:hypothetical protein
MQRHLRSIATVFTLASFAFGFAVVVSGCDSGPAPLQVEDPNTNPPTTDPPPPNPPDPPPPPNPPDPPPPPSPEPTDPVTAVFRLLDAYDSEDLTDYARTLTQDFRFRFSSDSDPDLASAYGNSWDRALELRSTQNFFSGYTNEDGDPIPGATSIEVDSFEPTVETDPNHSDSTAWYARITVSRLRMDITIGHRWEIEIASPVRIFVVRGDAAVLGADQPADASVWYVRRIEDRSREPRGSDDERSMSLGALRDEFAH